MKLREIQHSWNIDKIKIYQHPIGLVCEFDTDYTIFLPTDLANRLADELLDDTVQDLSVVSMGCLSDLIALEIVLKEKPKQEPKPTPRIQSYGSIGGQQVKKKSAAYEGARS